MTARDRLLQAVMALPLTPALPLGERHVAVELLLPVVEQIAAERAAEGAGQVLTDLAQRFRELGQFGAYCVVQQRIDARAAGLTDKDGQR